ncbi:hypothetical protein ACNAW0_00320 [Micromonospora sp. SL1-18]|uniref:hypothetical protein n=1 Tax=Micromonospora sp. SL1-18 TaxID=3399128 RepID=UPI003A4DD988
MVDPEQVSLAQLKAAFAPLGIALDQDFVRLELSEDKLTLYRLVRNPSGLPVSRVENCVQSVASTVAVVGEPPAGLAPTEPDPAPGG